MDVLFVSSVAVVSAAPAESRRLFIDALGLPLEQHPGSDYYSSEKVAGTKHFGVWPLSEAAQACFGTIDWPADRVVPQASIEFEVADVASVEAGALELAAKGHVLLHPARQEPWGPDRGAGALARGRHRRHLVRAMDALGDSHPG